MTTRIEALLNKIIRPVKTALAKRVVTLDISDDSVRLLEIRGGNVYQWASASLEADEGEAVSGQSVLGTTIQQLMTSTGIDAKKVMVSFSGLYSINRVLPLSSLPEGPSTGQQVVEEMVGDVMPLPLDELYFSGQRILAGDGGEYIHIFGIPRNVLEKTLRELKSIGIIPHTLEPRSIALTRLINRKQALILNVESTSIDLVLVANDVPEIVRTVSWSRSELTPGAQVEFLARNLETTVEFYNSKPTEANLDSATPLFITGQVSGEQTLLDKLQNRVGYKIELLAPLLEYPEHMPINQYAGNIGLVSTGSMLAQRDGRRYSPLAVNIMSQIHRAWRPSAMQLYSLAFIVIALALLMPALQVTQKAMSETAILQTKSDILNKELLQKKREMEKRIPLERTVKDYQIIIGMNTYLAEDIEVINELAEKVGISVESVNHNGTELSINCSSDNFTIFRNYIAALEESGSFASPVPPPEGYPYTTSGTIKVTKESK
ncbi:type IV pilus biogenesis protein PilM [Chloroflexota bacterium]